MMTFPDVSLDDRYAFDVKPFWAGLKVVTEIMESGESLLHDPLVEFVEPKDLRVEDAFAGSGDPGYMTSKTLVRRPWIHVKDAASPPG